MLSCYNLYDVDFTKKSIVKQTIIKHKKQKKYYVKRWCRVVDVAASHRHPAYIKTDYLTRIK